MYALVKQVRMKNTLLISIHTILYLSKVSLT